MWRFENTWIPSQASPPSGLPSPLRVMTQNLWFDSHQRETRMAGHLLQWQETQPHIIAVQEATLACLRLLLADPWLQSNYYSSVSLDSPAQWQGVVVFSQFPTHRLEMTALPGSMGRRLLQAEFPGLHLGVVHLESNRNSMAERAAQLEVVFGQLGRSQDALLVGDFNFCASSDENAQLPRHYLDLWDCLHPQVAGNTQDTARNEMLLKQTRKEFSVRYDRMLLRSSRWTCRGIELQGVNPLQAGLFASDHFGLLARLEG